MIAPGKPGEKARLHFPGRQAECKQLALAGDAEALVRSLLVRQYTGQLDSHRVCDFSRCSALENATQHIEFTLRQVWANAADPREHHLRNALLILAADCVVMPGGVGEHRSERFDQRDLPGLSAHG